MLIDRRKLDCIGHAGGTSNNTYLGETNAPPTCTCTSTSIDSCGRLGSGLEVAMMVKDETIRVVSFIITARFEGRLGQGEFRCVEQKRSSIHT
jgi:hypothetical protein